MAGRLLASKLSQLRSSKGPSRRGRRGGSMRPARASQVRMQRFVEKSGGLRCVRDSGRRRNFSSGHEGRRRRTTRQGAQRRSTGKNGPGTPRFLTSAWATSPPGLQTHRRATMPGGSPPSPHSRVCGKKRHRNSLVGARSTGSRRGKCLEMGSGIWRSDHEHAGFMQKAPSRSAPHVRLLPSAMPAANSDARLMEASR